MNIPETAIGAAQNALWERSGRFPVSTVHLRIALEAAAPIHKAQALRDLERELCVMDEHSDPNLEEIVRIIWRHINKLDPA